MVRLCRYLPLAVLLLCSCTDSTPPFHSTAETVTVEIKSWEDTQALIASHKGKVVIVDLWSTSCEPCMREFPNLVALHKKFGTDKIACIS